MDSSLDRLADIGIADSAILEFYGEMVPFASLGERAITWACTGEGYGMLVGGDSRLGYAKRLQEYVANDVGAGYFELVKLATVDVYRGAVGMGVSEEKNWEIEDAIVVILLEWKDEVAQRVAIGYLQSAEIWEKLPRGRKLISLG